MPMLELTDQQVVDLVTQLPPERKRTAILALADAGAAQRDERMEYAENQLRRAAPLSAWMPRCSTPFAA